VGVYDVQEKDFELKGKWREKHFKNDLPIVLELGCGKGEYSVGLGKKYPNKNFIGVDIKGNRMWVGAKEALETEMNNIAFLRARIDFIEAMFGENEVDEIWITFPDPHVREGKEKKRLTSPRFLNRYKKFLKPNGIIHLKTDSQMLHSYTLSVIEENKYPLIDATNDLYGEKIDALDDDTQDILSIKTHYETLFSNDGYDITYLKFRFN
jgi:tRNA (guanine-N7-)-methyltransferase